MAKSSREIRTKSENKQAVYRFILHNGPVTRQDIFSGLGLSLPTIKQALEFLEKERLITSGGVVENTGGRNATAYSVDDDTHYAIGVYISYHHLTAVCVDLAGNILHSKRVYIPLDLQSDSYMEMIGELVEDVKFRMDKKANLLGVGIAIPSLVSEDGESVIYGMTSDFSGITRSVFERYIPYPLQLFHDSNVAGYAEVWQSPEIRNALYLNLNNSIAGALIIDGQIYTGNNHLAGELGHVIIDPHSEKTCYCGQKGCFDTMCNAGVLDSYTGGDLEKFMELLKKGDAEAAARWDTYLDNLALAVHNFRMLLDCTIIIGGYIGSYMGDYLGDLHRRIDKLSIFTPDSARYVVPCKYKKEATAAGAAIQIIEKYIDTL